MIEDASITREYEHRVMIRLILPALAMIVLTPGLLHADQPVDFNRDIRPILSARCFACHGTDEKAREAGLRLDISDGATSPLDSGDTAVIPGDSGGSALIARVATDDSDLIMPPGDEEDPLSPKEVERLRRWVDQGAVWMQHWSYNRIERPA
ncbi:MAG: hypothetical protein GY826_02260, partial [Fuerstiella sp.]|nr:hypothetical protein [Fuerstiella sp.]